MTKKKKLEGLIPDLRKIKEIPGESRAIFREFYLKDENGEVEADFGFDGWYIFFPERKMLFIGIPETEMEKEEKYIEQIEQELKKDDFLPEGYNIIICQIGNVYNIGTLAHSDENL